MEGTAAARAAVGRIQPRGGRWFAVHELHCSAVFDALQNTRPRLCRPGVVSDPRATYRYRCGLRPAGTTNPSVFLSPAGRRTLHCRLARRRGIAPGRTQRAPGYRSPTKRRSGLSRHHRTLPQGTLLKDCATHPAEGPVDDDVPEVRLVDDDIVDAMQQHIPGYLDITPADLRAIYELAHEHAGGQRLPGAARGRRPGASDRDADRARCPVAPAGADLPRPAAAHDRRSPARSATAATRRRCGMSRRHRRSRCRRSPGSAR